MPLSRRRLLLLLPAIWGGSAAMGQKRGASAMQLTLMADRPVFWTAQEPVFEVTLRNTGSAPREAPSLTAVINRQPAYTLRGPSYPAGMTRGMRVESPDMPPIMETVGAGQELSARIGIQDMFGVLKPGDYTLSVAIDLPDFQVRSETVSFTVVATRTLQTGISVDDGAQDSYPLRVGLLAEDRDGTALGMAIFTEAGAHKNLLEFRTNFPIARLTGKPVALLAMAANRVSLFEPQVRLCARTERELSVWNPEKLGLDTLPLPEKARVLRPAVAGAGDELSAFIVDPAAGTCGVLRFPLNGVASAGWSHKIAAPVVSGRAAIGADNQVCAVLLAENASGSDVMLVEQSGVRQVVLPDLKPYTDSEPGLWRGGDGRVHCGLILRTGDPRTPRLITIEWPEDGKPGLVGGSAVALPEPARAFAVAYSVAPGQRRLVWCAVLESGGLKTAVWEAPPGWLKSRLSVPLELLVLAEQVALTGITSDGRADLIKIA